MKQANFAPVFAFMYIGLCNIARENGYALAVHGTLNCDFDLVATPWTDKAIEPFDLVKQIEERIGICEPDIFLGLHSQEPELKPHGRLAWLIKLGNGAALDISVMPKLQSQQSKIELLEKELTETQAFLNKQNHIKQAKIDELQKQVITQGQNFNDQAQKLKDTEYFNQKLQARINDALNTLCKLQYSSGERIYNDVGGILKGNKDEN